ncbi:MAG: 3,4-dihydroxy-2-butanone-4-phosphate synthase [Rhizobiales bacterium]|nr:3,4-dihydroxy-2-butanone-4-phosphate synthase [Hyphomicrobiales bacterium]
MSNESHPVQLDPVEEAVAAIANGEMVVVVDDDDRENEGDLIVAAAKVTPEQMGFIVRHTTGIVCVPMPRKEARRLSLVPMVADNDAPMSTAFTVSVDYKEGLTTGISAAERTGTARALANDNVHADDFVRPGHMFPLIAKRGGVLMRSGHTEAAVDLAKLAKLPPVGVISELVNDDGTVKKGDQVFAFARKYGLKIISVADLIEYRQSRERLVDQVSTFEIKTRIGTAKAISYTTPFDTIEHLAVIFGDISSGESVPARLHREDVLEDALGDRNTLERMYDWFDREGRGVLIYLRVGAAGVPGAHLGEDVDDEDTASARNREQVWRDIGLGAQILRDLEVKSIKLLASRDRTYVGLSGFGIEISETELIDGDQ